ncbi:MAG: transcription-repair coupling factor [Chloroflexi bacterium]|nr:transcription-repair coupling factor [Chloroflexota bacterium]
MSLRPLLRLLDDALPAIDPAKAKGRPIALTLPDPATAFAVAALWNRLRRPVLLLVPYPETARRLADQLAVWCDSEDRVFHYTESEILPFERLIPDSPAIHTRLRALAALRGAPSEPPLVVSSVAAATRLVLDPTAFDRATRRIRVGDVHNLDRLVESWVAAGYEIKPAVEGPGTASRRGGILDVFPITDDDPSRIEFFGDEVESIRRFDPETQRSTAPAESIVVTPARTTLPRLASQDEAQRLAGALDFATCDAESGDRISAELGQLFRGEVPDWLAFYSGFFDRSSIFDYLPADAVVIALRQSEIEDVAQAADRRLEDHRLAKEKRGEIPRRFPQPHLEWGLFADALRAHGPAVSLSPWGVDDPDLSSPAIRLPFMPPPVTGGQTDRVLAWLADSANRSGRIVVLSQHAARIRELMAEHGVLAEGLSAGGDGRDGDGTGGDLPGIGAVAVAEGSLREGFVLAIEGAPPLTLFTDAEMLGIAKERRPVQKRFRRRAAQLKDLQPGVYLVHIEHGIGRFVDTVTVEGQAGREYLLLEYAEGDKLYVPVDQLDRLTPYHGGGDDPPKLTRLGTQEWARAKARARRATEQLAGELLALYAARAATQGFAARPDTPWQDQLEASFPYEETPDQATTIAEVKADLEAQRPADRLVCGDVGYGKTEVAIRAAFKVVQSGRQVAVLVPTTVLAQQHLLTFRERLGAFPVTIDALSRLRNDQEQDEIVKRLASGRLDIVIGTHRLLQRDVSFKDLGLIVIDEEHRFGVVHKERLKRMRSEVDVLAMSATPIPRTLYLSLSGIRDMSTIDTPPEDRLPIKTYVSEESDELVREAILRELDRGGQVFYLHNRVKTIDYFADRLAKLIPEARIAVGHGRMREEDLEQVMTDFGEDKFDVLVCTTIIESGLDLPNVNTLIVDRADRFGLAQLYQIRGRIGRSARRAYSYLIVPKGKQLTETAEERLNTILAATELGVGYQIAMRDLEIRGAGNILGAEQSGQIAAVGFDLYSKLLAEAVADIKADAEGKPKPERARDFSQVQVDLGIDARLPYTYVEDFVERLTLYHRIARIVDLDAVEDLQTELRDRFGPLPRQAELLLYQTRIRVLAEACNADSVTAQQDRLTIALKEPIGDARAALQRVIGRLADVGHMQIRLEIDREDDEWMDRLESVLDEVAGFRQKMLQMLATGAAANAR